VALKNFVIALVSDGKTSLLKTGAGFDQLFHNANLLTPWFVDSRPYSRAEALYLHRYSLRNAVIGSTFVARRAGA
jgi:hypothetical protein